MKNLILITGAVRSGKSTFAEKLAGTGSQRVVYIATMPELAGDLEQERRINRHKQRRPRKWQTIESAYELTKTISNLPSTPTTCLIDCLSLYVSNMLVSAVEHNDKQPPHEQEEQVLAQVDAVLETISRHTHIHFIVVTNEVGWGVVPETPLGRSFRDVLGVANQRFAAAADEVWLTCVGLPVRLKPQSAT